MPPFKKNKINYDFRHLKLLVRKKMKLNLLPAKNSSKEGPDAEIALKRTILNRGSIHLGIKYEYLFRKFLEKC